jgi:hypothetical protein
MTYLDAPFKRKRPSPVLISKFKRARFVRRLQESYGYNKQEAKNELDRLLKEFFDKTKQPSNH